MALHPTSAEELVTMRTRTARYGRRGGLESSISIDCKFRLLARALCGAAQNALDNTIVIIPNWSYQYR